MTTLGNAPTFQHTHIRVTPNPLKTRPEGGGAAERQEKKGPSPFQAAGNYGNGGDCAAAEKRHMPCPRGARVCGPSRCPPSRPCLGGVTAPLLRTPLPNPRKPSFFHAQPTRSWGLPP